MQQTEDGGEVMAGAGLSAGVHSGSGASPRL